LECFGLVYEIVHIGVRFRTLTKFTPVESLSGQT